MFKKICSALVCAAMIAYMGISVLAADIVNITRPEASEESTFNSSYVLCGNTGLSDVIVELSLFDRNLGYYVPYQNTDGESYWSIGSSGMFAKEVSLPNLGANKIQVTAYSSSNPYEKQYESFTINLLNNGIKDRIVNGSFNFSEVFNNTWKIFQ